MASLRHQHQFEPMANGSAKKRHSWVHICNKTSGEHYYWDQQSGQTQWTEPSSLTADEVHTMEKIEVGNPQQHPHQHHHHNPFNHHQQQIDQETQKMSSSNKAPPAPPQLAWERVEGPEKDYWWNPQSDETRWTLPDPLGLETESAAVQTYDPDVSAQSTAGGIAQTPAQRSPGSGGGGGRRRRFFGGSFGPGHNPTNSSGSSGTVSAAAIMSGDNSQEASSKDDKSMRKSRKSKSGKGLGKADAPDEGSEITVSAPFGVEHKLHVRFDTKRARFSGLPKDWDISKQALFGVELAQCPRVEIEGYDSRIPIVLVILRKHLERLGGLTTEGIFRIAPDGTECQYVKNALNTGVGAEVLDGCTDPHVPANLIKQFFRELKPSLLGQLSRDQVVQIAEAPNPKGNIPKAMDDLSEPARSVFLWLLDLLCSIAQNESQNKMTLKNLAIVISPNLYNMDDMPPMEALVVSQKLATALENILLWRRDSAPSPAIETQSPTSPHVQQEINRLEASVSDPSSSRPIPPSIQDPVPPHSMEDSSSDSDLPHVEPIRTQQVHDFEAEVEAQSYEEEYENHHEAFYQNNNVQNWNAENNNILSGYTHQQPPPSS